MPKSFQRFFYGFLIPGPFVLGVWIALAWLIFQRSVGSFISLFVAIPAGFIQIAILGLMLWLRPSIRSGRNFQTADALFYFGTFLAWALGAALSSPWNGILFVVAFILGVLGMARIGKTSRDEAVATMTERADRLRETLHQSPPPAGPRFPPASGPGAGRVYVVRAETFGRGQPAGSSSDRPNERENRPIEGEIIDESTSTRRDNDDPDVEEWRARPHST